MSERLFPLGLFGLNWRWFGKEAVRASLMSLRGGFDGDLSAVEYLRSGAIISAPMEGMTGDVISGEREFALAGNSILTDGTFFWRGDTADYVETHRVGLRPEFMAHGVLRDWTYPLLPEAFLGQRVLPEADYGACNDAIMGFLRGEAPGFDLDEVLEGELPSLSR